MTLLSCFVAAPSSDLRRAEDFIFQLRRFAIISEDWPSRMRERELAGLSDADLTYAESAVIARQCKAGILSADLVIWLSGPSLGAAWEASLAVAAGIPVIASGEPHKVYRSACTAILPDDAHAITWCADYATRIATVKRSIAKGVLRA